MDAFNDILYGGFGTPNEGFHLVWKNAVLSRQRLGYEETVKWYEAALKTCHPSNVPEMQARLRLARQGKGDTVFDWLIGIINDHQELELQLEDR